jgi:parvulin-like peptidyl-prolyl isomerase
VNGAPITERDLEHRWKRGAKGAPGHDAAADANVLQTLVREELVYQKATQLGLDRDEQYRVRLDDLEAQVRAFKRQEMATRLRMWALQQSAVSDAEARAWFDANAALVRSRLHVLQILYKGERPEALKDAQEVKAGVSFEEVAARRYGAAPAGARAPWDLGELAWHQLPPQWRGVVDRLEPGQTSGVIDGEGDRAWVVKLVARRVEPTVSLETEKAKIVDVLASEKARELYERVLAEAKAKAAISYAKAN